MATDRDYVTFVLDQLSELEAVTCRTMMGEYILYYREKIVFYLCDNRLLAKIVPASEALLPDAPREAPYPGAKDMLLVQNVDDREALVALVRAMYPELPPPKPRHPKRGE